METITQSFKNAIKSVNREVKGYVEVIYKTLIPNLMNYDNYTETANISSITQINDNNRIVTNYASLEKDYFLLDGSFILPNLNVEDTNAGYITKNVTENVNIEINNINLTVPAITIYFKDNIPKNFILTIDNIEYKYENNEEEVIQIVFEQEKEIFSLKLQITKTSNPNLRVRIPEIDFGITSIYRDRNLVSFSFNEEIDFLMESFPTNDCTVNLNNYDKKFDPINPIGITKYLTDNVVIKPYIGILTEDYGIEYVSCGIFYLNDWNSDTDSNVTLNGSSLMEKLKSLTLISNGNFLEKDLSIKQIGTMFSNLYDYTFDFSSDLTIYNYSLKTINIFEYLKAIISYSVVEPNDIINKFYVSRNNKIIQEPYNFNVVDTIYRNELITEADYKTKTTINKIIYEGTHNYSTTGKGEEDLLNQKYILKKSIEYVWFKLSKYNMRRDYQFSYSTTGTGSAEIIDDGGYLVYIKLTGNIGDLFELKLNGEEGTACASTNYEFENNEINGQTITINFKDIFDSGLELTDNAKNFYLTKDSKYKASLQYIGNPALTVGDTINVETQYGFKNVIITKHSLTFDGGLSGSIEGVGN